MFAPKIKCKLALALLVSLSVLCGCAHQYLLSLDDGDQILSRNKPKRYGNLYQFMGNDGVEHVIPQARVTRIRPVTIPKEEQAPVSTPKPKQPRHWYFLWLH
jgi:hypothetical protein